MRRTFAILALIGVASFFLWPSPARSQNSAQDGQSFKGNVYPQLVGGVVRSDSTSKAFTMSSTGGLSIYDEDRDRDKVTLWQSAVCGGITGCQNGTALAIGAADSTAILDVHAYRILKLLLKAVPASGDTSTRIRIALQFRECMNGNSDSSSTFVEYMYGASPMGAGSTASAGDTTLAGHLLRGNAGSPWSGEYVILFDNARGAVANSIPVNGRLFYYPSGLSIPLDSFFGRPVRFNRLQVRIRNLGYVLTAQSAPLKYDLSIIGFAQ